MGEPNGECNSSMPKKEYHVINTRHYSILCMPDWSLIIHLQINDLGKTVCHAFIKQ